MSLAFQLTFILSYSSVCIKVFTSFLFRFIPLPGRNLISLVTGLSEFQGTDSDPAKKTEKYQYHLPRITVKFSRTCDDRVLLVATHETENDET